MGESDKNVNKRERRFSQKQYEFLMKCVEKGEKGIKEWNEWRKQNRGEQILLGGVDLAGAKLSWIDLSEAHLEGAVLSGAIMGVAHLERGELTDAQFENTHLVGTRLNGANLENANFRGAKLRGSSTMLGYPLDGADFRNACLKGARFRDAVVDESTVFWDCVVDRNTDFRGVALESTRMYPSTRQLLEYNIRRMNWEDWYKEHWFWRWPFRLFWLFSDYGASGKRVVGVFFLLAFLFAAVYMNWGYWRPPGIVSNLVVQPEVGEAVWHYFGRAVVRPVYFSIVTMTTLGFGDMYANKGSIAGHVILAVQVILGYVLLGALITRFAVLFTAGGPAGKFAESGKGPD